MITKIRLFIFFVVMRHNISILYVKMYSSILNYKRGAMKTVYVDIYFFINFCVDVLALSIATYFVKIKCGALRLIISGIIGALYAILALLFSDYKFLIPIFTVFLFVAMILIVTYGISVNRKIKYSFAFLVSEIIIGGLVYYGFCALDRVMEKLQISTQSGENRNFLIWSIIVLLSFGVIKLIMYVFGATASTRVIRLCAGCDGREYSFEALVDTGNLAVDPSDKRPVVFITPKLAESILGEKIDFFDDISQAPLSVRKRIRIIPSTLGGERTILYGFLSDYVTAVKDNKYENISVTFAVDRKGETYGGYSALLPSSAIDNVF